MRAESGGGSTSSNYRFAMQHSEIVTAWRNAVVVWLQSWP